MVVACRTQQLLNTSKNISFSRTVKFSKTTSAFAFRSFFDKNNTQAKERQNLRLCDCRSFHTSKEPRSALAKLSPQEILTSGVSADFYYPDCQYAGFSCLDCYTQKYCLNLFGLIHWSDASCVTDLTGHSTPYCDPSTDACTAVLPNGCTSVSFYTCLRDGIFPDLNDCTIYYKCTNNTSEEFICPENYVYKQQYGKCVYKLSDSNCFQVSSCSSANPSAIYPGDPALYYSCSGNTLRLSACAENETFNSQTKSCESICKSQGLLPYPQSCSDYFSCENIDTELVAVQKVCSDGYGFDPNSNTCQLDYQNLCNELALLDDDVTDFLDTIPIVNSLVAPIKELLKLFNLNPLTLILKFGISDDIVSTGILIADYIYKNKALPPTTVSVIVTFILPYLPNSIQTIIETLLNLGLLNLLEGPAKFAIPVASLQFVLPIDDGQTQRKSNDGTQTYLENALLGARIDVVGILQSLQGKTSAEISSEVFRQTLRAFNVPESHIPLVARIIQNQLPVIAISLNKQVGVPLFKIGDQNALGLDIRGVDNIVQNTLNEVALNLYPNNHFLAEIFKIYARQLYMAHRNEVVSSLNELQLSVDTL